MQKYFYIAVGGAFGSIARYWVGSTCAMIGFSLTFLAKRTGLNPAWRFLVPIGFIGAYSTFSTYEWETLSTLRSGAFLEASLYAFGSLFLGLVATWLGVLIAEAI